MWTIENVILVEKSNSSLLQCSSDALGDPDLVVYKSLFCVNPKPWKYVQRKSLNRLFWQAVDFHFELKASLSFIPVQFSNGLRLFQTVTFNLENDWNCYC